MHTTVAKHQDRREIAGGCDLSYLTPQERAKDHLPDCGGEVRRINILIPGLGTDTFTLCLVHTRIYAQA